MSITRFELDSTSNDDNVISVIRQLQREVIEKLDKDQGSGTGEAIVLSLRRTATTYITDGFRMLLGSVVKGEVNIFIDAVADVAAEYVMSKRHTENTGLFSSATDRNDTEALRTLSVLAFVALDNIKESAKSWNGLCDTYTTAFYVGLHEAALQATRELVDEITDRDGVLGVYNLLTAVRVLVSRHETRGWSWVLDIVCRVLVERGLYLSDDGIIDDDANGDGDSDVNDGIDDDDAYVADVVDAGDPPEPVADPLDPDYAD